MTVELYGTGVCTIQIDNHGIVDVGTCMCTVVICTYVRLDGQRFPCRELESDKRTKAWHGRPLQNLFNR